ncbi:MAG TPA: AMIN domain-containing protein [Clostridia bacterium]|nr:AMIN domain-containing protein [Clostridia bacterium]
MASFSHTDDVRLRFRHYRDLQVWLAFAYGVQVGRQRMMAGLQRVAEQCARATGASTAAVAVVQQGTLRPLVACGQLAPQLTAPAELDDTLVAHCTRTGIPQMRLEPLPGSHFPEIQSLIYYPLQKNEATAGVLAVFAGSPDAFTAHDLRVVELFARDVCLLLGWHQHEARPLALAEASHDDPAAAIGEPPAEAVTPPQTAAEIRFAQNLEPETSRRPLAITVVLVLTAAMLYGVSYGVVRWRGLAELRPAGQPAGIPAPMPPVATDAAPETAAEVPALREVAIRNEGVHDFVVFRFAGPIEYKVGRLKSPDRIFVDFPNAAAQKAAHTGASAANVESVRIGHDPERGTRAVLDLKRQSDYLIVQNPDQSSIVIDVFPIR